MDQRDLVELGLRELQLDSCIPGLLGFPFLRGKTALLFVFFSGILALSHWLWKEGRIRLDWGRETFVGASIRERSKAFCWERPFPFQLYRNRST